MQKTAERPTVKHIYQNHHLDTTRWDRFVPLLPDMGTHSGA